MRPPRTYDLGKRVFDLVISIGALLLGAPVLAVTAVAVRLWLGSPVLFRQSRPGLHGRPFTMVKFRTMKDSVSLDGRPLPDAERLTRFGALLRSTSLDELPELWNVVRGDMSLVGPRPLLMEYLERYTPVQARRHEVAPGITGWAQINGRNAVSWDERFRMDVWYVDHRSFALDMRILWLTVVKVLRRDGISQPGHATAVPFAGSSETLHTQTVNEEAA